MLKPFSFISRKKPTTRPFKDYYTDWFNTLKNHLLPLLRHSLSSSSSAPTRLFYSHVDLLLHHLLSFYDALDAAATPDSVPHLLFPSWRTPLETPFLFLGDLHPYLFTNLLRSFLDNQTEEEIEQSDIENEERSELYDVGDIDLDRRSQVVMTWKDVSKTFLDDQNEEEIEQYVIENEAPSELYDVGDIDLDKPWQAGMAWKDVSKNLMAQIEHIECGLRLMVPALSDRARKAQAGFVKRVAEAWVGSDGKKERMVGVGKAVKMEMEEMVIVFVDANRLRRSVIMEIVGKLNVFQGALFLEGLAQFLVGFRDPDLLGEFESCNIPINKQVRIAL